MDRDLYSQSRSYSASVSQRRVKMWKISCSSKPTSHRPRGQGAGERHVKVQVLKKINLKLWNYDKWATCLQRSSKKIKIKPQSKLRVTDVLLAPLYPIPILIDWQWYLRNQAAVKTIKINFKIKRERKKELLTDKKRGQSRSWHFVE